MDIINDNANKTDTKQNTPHGGKHHKVKKVEGKKPVLASADKLPETRNRARSSLVNPFDNKKPMNSKKESKPVETIGSDRFNLLKSMFEKKGPPATAEVTTKKFEPKFFSNFQQKDNNQTTEEKKTDSVSIQPAGISEGIKKRMQDLMSSNRRSSAQPTIDPILEQRRKEREISNDDPDDEEDEDEENLGISEDEESLEKDDEFSELEEEKQNENVKKEEIKKEKNDSILEDEDSFEEKKEDNEVAKKEEIDNIELKEDNIKETEETNIIKSDSDKNAVTDNTNQGANEEIKHSLNIYNHDQTTELQQREINHETRDFGNKEHKEQELNNNHILKESHDDENF